MNDYTIAITTFSKRYDYVVKLIKQIRSHTNKTIVLSINGEKDGIFNDDYRKKILEVCSSYENVYPSFFIETRGLSKMWNSLLIMSYYDNILMLNDDIEILESNIFQTVENHINSDAYLGLTKINNSFSHFIVNKTLMDRIGYFDERLLGFGEEDGDITYRLLKIGIPIINISVTGVINIVTNIRHDHITAGIGKYSKFNRDFIYNFKYSPNMSSNYRGMFDTPMDQKLPDLHQYPTEQFFLENKSKL